MSHYPAAICGLVMLLYAPATPADGEPPHFPAAVDVEEVSELLTDGVSNPADIIRFKGRYVVTELLNNRLAIFDYPAFDGFEYFDPVAIGESFKSPHYMALSPSGGLLVSNGWGSSIVHIDDLDGKGWRSFSGIGKKFDAPHGICVDPDGWIYVGDSLNSRLVRFRDMTGAGWQVFGDVENTIAYVRDLTCNDGGIWVSNSYEDRPGLNPGRGSNVLRITDFDSGTVEVVFAIEGSNMTGLLPLPGDRALVGLWGKRSQVAEIDFVAGTATIVPRFQDGLGTPYGFFLDAPREVLFVTHTGALVPEDPRKGAVAIHGRPPR